MENGVAGSNPAISTEVSRDRIVLGERKPRKRSITPPPSKESRQKSAGYIVSELTVNGTEERGEQTILITL